MKICSTPTFTLAVFSAIGQNGSLILKNIDSIAGEIKSMDKCVVTVKTDYSDKDFKIT
jgi:hypothetical protein